LANNVSASRKVVRTVAIIGGQPAQFRGLIDRYRETGARAGHAPEKLTVGVHPIGFLAETSARAAETFWPAYRETFGRIGRERGGRRRPGRSSTRNTVRPGRGWSVTPRPSPKRWFPRIVCSAVWRD
jgi:alkanesulfonate monooxygenase SsuD/methylene tetrahydromethanopterin reductase-like flavin-dependent oxidoreductase (luciferase family)